MTTTADNTLHNAILAAIATDTLPWLAQSDASPTALPAELLDEASDESPTGARNPLIVAGDGAAAQPIFDALNATIDELHDEMVIAGDSVGIGNIAGNFTKLGETVGPSAIGEQPNPYGESNIVTDAVNVGGDLITGDLGGILTDIGRDTGQALDQVHVVKDSLLFGPDELNFVPELIEATGDALQSTPLITLSGHDGLLGGTIGDLTHSSSGHLIDIDIGPRGDHGFALDVLSTATGGMVHALELNVLDVGSNGPSLLDLDILTGNGLFGHDPLGLL